MIKGGRVEGLEKVVKAFNRKAGAIADKTFDGILAAGLIFQGEAQRRVPVEYGNLRASGYTRPEKGTKPTKDNIGAVLVGFGAAYALYVHENREQTLKGQDRPSGLGVYWGPKGEPQYLTNAIVAKQKQALKAIADRAGKGIKS